MQGATIHTSEGLYTDIVLRKHAKSSSNGASNLNGSETAKCLEDTLSSNGGSEGKLEDPQTWASASNGQDSSKEKAELGAVR